MKELTFGVNADSYGVDEFCNICIFRAVDEYQRRGVSFATKSISVMNEVDDTKQTICQFVEQVFPELDIEYMQLGDFRTLITARGTLRGTFGEHICFPVLVIELKCNDYESNTYKPFRQLPHNQQKSTTFSIKETTIKISGEYNSISILHDALSEAYKRAETDEVKALVKWQYADEDGSVSDRIVRIDKSWTIYKEFYPSLEAESLNSYYDKFQRSTSQILILYGPPGTGKTSFIRDMLCEARLNAVVTHDASILTTDRMYVQFLLDNVYDTLVIEDADDLLTCHRGDNNKIISKILNASDGLVKLPAKKLIFTTNLPKISDIDEAILRPGRCFDVMEFRSLSKAEAVPAGRLIGLTEKDFDAFDQPTYTLADIFSMKTSINDEDPLIVKKQRTLTKSIGFL